MYMSIEACEVFKGGERYWDSKYLQKHSKFLVWIFDIGKAIELSDNTVWRKCDSGRGESQPEHSCSGFSCICMYAADFKHHCSATVELLPTGFEGCPSQADPA